MDRRHFLKFTLFTGVLLSACRNKKSSPVHYWESEVGKNITLEGEILHVCPIEGMKMKLRLADGEIISVLPATGNSSFDKSLWNKKKVKIYGKLSVSHLERSVIAANYKEKKLLCHIDHTPCIDTKWIENRWKDGSAEDLLKRDYNALIARMGKTGRNFIQVFSVVAEEISEI